MHEVLVNRLGSLSLPKKSVVRLTDRPDMTLDVYRGRKTTQQHNNNNNLITMLTSKRGTLVEWLEGLDYGAEGRHKVVSSGLGFAMGRLENSLLTQE